MPVRYLGPPQLNSRGVAPAIRGMSELGSEDSPTPPRVDCYPTNYPATAYINITITTSHTLDGGDVWRDVLFLNELDRLIIPTISDLVRPGCRLSCQRLWVEC